MTLAAWALAVLATGDTLVLKESARLEGRFVRVIDLVEAGTLDEVSRAALSGIYLGRVPEAGQTRIIPADEIRRVLEFQGFEAARFRFSREEVAVRRAEGLDGTAEIRGAIAAAIQKQVLARHPGLRPEEVEVRLVSLEPPAWRAGGQLVDVRASGPAGFGKGEFTAVLSSPAAAEVRVEAEVIRARRVAAVTPAARPGPVVKARAVVRAESPSYEVDARALEDGAAGDEILLEFVSTRNRFRGRVTGTGRVEVIEGRP